MSVVLCILDGWGLGEKNEYNAIHLAKTPNFDYLMSNHPHSKLKNNGEDVGLPEGQMGNSEVGHITIGCGRVIFQDLPKISRSINTGELKNNPVLMRFIKSGKPCHIVGLISDGGVHSHIEHIIALCQILTIAGIEVNLHAISDGRDVSPQCAIKYLERLKNHNIQPKTLMGRFYAMDRDKRKDRTEAAFQSIANAQGKTTTDFAKAVQESYAEGIHDEFIEPVVLQGYNGMQAGDNILIANFRADRVRQISQAFIEHSQHTLIAGMTEYSSELAKNMEVLFKNEQPTNTLGEVISKAGLKQFRIAETEKYAHVTYFFNGGREELFEGEERVMIPSPKVSTYDLKPEMSAAEVASTLVKAINAKKYAFLCVNFANADMVGHSGNIKATVQAIEAVDTALGDVITACKNNNYDLLITADHGNAEELYDSKTKQPLTSHTMNLVPFIYAGSTDMKLNDGGLRDIMPTVLELLKIQTPAEISGKSLISKK